MSELKSLENEKDVVADSSIGAVDGTDYNVEYGSEIKTTHRHLKPRHVQLIAISGAIGTGLFIGTGGALARAGPLSLLLGYAVYGALVLVSFNSMGEMCSYLPIDGSYLRFAGRFVDPSYGFAMGWVATYNNAVTVAAEATAVAGLIAFWNDTISPGVWCALFLASALALNVFGVKFFGEGEFWFSIFKVMLVFMLFFFTFITMLGGNPSGDRYGFRNWKQGDVMKEHIADGSWGRFLGFWSIFIQAAFAYGGPDFLAMTAGEARYPRRILPNVFRRVIYRLLFFYIGGVLCVGILIPSDDPLLGTAQKGAGSSPFVLASVRLGIPVLPHVINALILTSAWSCGICLSFTASRNLYALALAGHAPSLLKKTWRGVPHFCVVAVVAVGILSFMTLSDGAATAFSWITNILGGLWILNLALQQVIYIRFRAGLRAMGIDRKTLPFQVRGQLVYAWIALVGYSVIFLTNGFAVFTNGNWSIRSFAFAYLTLPFFIVCYGGHKIYSVVRYGSKWGILRPDEMDLVTGKAEVDEDEKTYPIRGTSKNARFQTWLWG